MSCEHCHGEHWNPASRFPTPGIELQVRLNNGDITTAIRPRYVSSYNVNPGYIGDGEQVLQVVEWQYK